MSYQGITGVLSATPVSSMPTAHQEALREQYQKYQEAQKAKKAKEQQPSMPKEEGISPKALGMKRSPSSEIELTTQVRQL